MKCYISHNGACWLCWIWWFISISCDTMISHPRLFWWICYGSCLCTRPRQFKGSVQQMEKILSVILFLGYSDCDKTALFYLKSLLGPVFRTPAGYWPLSEVLHEALYELAHYLNSHLQSFFFSKCMKEQNLILYMVDWWVNLQKAHTYDHITIIEFRNKPQGFKPAILIIQPLCHRWY